MKLNMDARNFRLFSPDESNSNRWQDALEVTNRASLPDTGTPGRSTWRLTGALAEMLSEHQCQGWLEGHSLTGRVTASFPATRRLSTSSIPCSTSTPNG